MVRLFKYEILALISYGTIYFSIFCEIEFLNILIF